MSFEIEFSRVFEYTIDEIKSKCGTFSSKQLQHCDGCPAGFESGEAPTGMGGLEVEVKGQSC